MASKQIGQSTVLSLVFIFWKLK